tara:strand:+ start:293 stop:1519 length:1227 start_codon:yes stop_codon:yes gene_type:complete
MVKRTGGFIGQDGLNAPDPATGVTGTAGDASVSVAFTAPSDVGASAITGYRAQSNNGIGVSGSSSPINVTGLTNGTSYTFNVWAINPFGYSSPSDASGSVSPQEAAWALVAGFASGGTYLNTIDVYNINTNGNSSDFGDLTVARATGAVMGAVTRLVFSAGRTASETSTNIMDYVNPTSAGNATDFGDLVAGKQEAATFGNKTRGISAGGEGPSQGAPNYQFYDNLEYITYATTSNTTDFGNLTQHTQVAPGFSSPTRGVRSTGKAIEGGGDPVNTMDYVTIASTGNALDFGDATTKKYGAGCCASSTRGLTAGGNSGDPDYTNLNVIEYVTISSTGNGTDFGDLLGVVGLRVRGASSQTRGTFMGPGVTICVVTIATTGNAVDFGDLTTTGSAESFMAGSNAHGGLQ